MPIYKLSTSTLSASVRRSQPTPGDAVSVGAKANGDVVVSENRGHEKDNLYAQRPSPAEVGTRRCLALNRSPLASRIAIFNIGLNETILARDLAIGLS